MPLNFITKPYSQMDISWINLRKKSKKFFFLSILEKYNMKLASGLELERLTFIGMKPTLNIVVMDILSTIAFYCNLTWFPMELPEISLK